MFKKNAKNKETGTVLQVKKRGKKRIKIISAVVIIVLILALLLWKALSGGETIPMVDVTEVKKGNLISQLDTSGTVVSLSTRTYFSPVNANIKTYDLKVGRVVKKGDTLVSFETDTLEQDNRRAELSAKATINTNNDTVEKNRKALSEASIASQNVDIIQGDIDNFQAYIEDLNAAIADRTSQLALKTAEEAADAYAGQSQEVAVLNRALTLAVRKETLETANEQYHQEMDALAVRMSQAEFDNDQNTARILQEQIDRKQKMLEENENAIRILEQDMGEYADKSAEELRNELSAISAGGGYSGTADAAADTQILQWQMDLQEAQTTLAELQGQLSQEEAKVSAGEAVVMTTAGKKAMENSNNMAELESSTVEELLQKGKKGIQAEFSGIVTRADLTQGAAATQGMELVTVASNREVAVETSVSKYDYGDLQEGQEATVTIGKYTYHGQVSSISKVAEVNERNAPVISCEVKLLDPDDNVFLGVEAKVNITVAEKQNVLSVPIEAVNTGRDGTFCYVLEDGKILRKEITTGISTADSTEILSGLQEGELVIPMLPDGLEEGMEAQSVSAQAEEENGD